MVYRVILVLMFCLSANAEELFIATDDNRESLLVTAAIEKSLRDRVNPNIVVESYAPIISSEDARNYLSDKTIIINRYDFENREKNRVPTLTGYPYYRIGRYGEWKEIPKAAFIHPTYTARYLKFVLDEHQYPQKKLEWDKRVFNLRMNYYMDFNWMDYIFTPGLDNCIVNDYESLIDFTTKAHRINPEAPLMPLVAFPPEPILENPLETLNLE